MTPKRSQPGNVNREISDALSTALKAFRNCVGIVEGIGSEVIPSNELKALNELFMAVTNAVITATYTRDYKDAVLRGDVHRRGKKPLLDQQAWDRVISAMESVANAKDKKP